MTTASTTKAAPRTPPLAMAGVLVGVAAVVFIVAVDIIFLVNGRPFEALFSLIPLLAVIVAVPLGCTA